MKKRTHFARKKRQLASHVKKLETTTALPNKHKLVVKIQRLVADLKSVMAPLQLKKLLGTAVLFIGLSASPNTALQAQPFAVPQVNPFGLVALGEYSNIVPTFSDLDDDGDFDIMAIDTYTGTPTYFENSGTATQAKFESPQSFPFGLTDTIAYGSIGLGDFDDDGDQDIIASTSDGQLKYYENTGSASEANFGDAKANPFNIDTTAAIKFPRVVDLDGDGDLDIITEGDYGDGTLFFENIGTTSVASFDMPTQMALPIIGFPSTLGDLDQDGDLDLLAGGVAFAASLSNTTYYENTGNANESEWADPQVNLLGVVPFSFFTFPHLVDIDGDGDLDIMAGTTYLREGSIYFYENLAISTPTSTQIVVPQNAPLNIDFVGEYQFPSFADLDGDGDQDILMVSTDTLLYYPNEGTASDPNFGEPVSSPFGLLSRSFILGEFVDLDGDGDSDLLGFAYDTEGATVYFENKGTSNDPQFSDGVINPFGLTSTASFVAHAAVDLDGDGDMDLLTGQYGNGDTYLLYFENTGTATAPQFAAPQTSPFGLMPSNQFAFPTAADVDGDGDTDLIVGQYSYLDDSDYARSPILYYENTGTATAPQFAAPQTETFGNMLSPTPMFPKFADLDGDGDQDLYAGSYNYTDDSEEVATVFYFFENRGPAWTVGFETAPSTSNFSVDVYPNPTQDWLQISVEKTQDIVLVELMDIQGKTVQTHSGFVSQISLIDLSTGTYFVRITDKEGNSVVKKVMR